MEPPPPAPPPFSAPVSAAVAAAAAAANFSYPDSVDSSPRSRNTDSWDEQMLPGGGGAGAKLRLMCSYGGHIVPRPHDKSLCYVGGDTRIVVADRHSSLLELSNRLSKTLLNGRSFSLKYQLPNEDLDSLISVTSDEDLENMIDEYDRLAAAATMNTTQKSSRLRLFLFPSKPDSASSIGSLLESSTKSEDWFLNALNGTNRGFSESASVNSLLGLDDDVAVAGDGNSPVKDLEAQRESFGNVKDKQGVPEVHSVPDSPMLDTTSSFGSTSSAPSLGNLPPIRVHVEDRKRATGLIEEQFSQMSVGDAAQKLDDGGFQVFSSRPTVLSTVAAPVPAPAAAVQGMGLGSAGLPGEFSNRFLSDEERLEQGMPIGFQKPAQHQPQPLPLQSQFKPTGGVDLASPDSISSDSSTTNPLSRQRAMIYQDPAAQNPLNNYRVPDYPVEPKLSDPNSRVQMQQVQDSGYILPGQFDQQHQPFNPQQQQQQQQFVQATSHYIQHHPNGSIPMASYYPVYPRQQQQFNPQHPLDQQYSVFYLPARQAQAYNLPPQQPNYNETAPTVPQSSRPQTPPASAMIPSSASYTTARNPPPSNPELAAGMYRTAASAAPPLVQVPSNQHHPQYAAPTSAATTAKYAYEFGNPAHAQLYYTQALAPQLASQYQTMSSAPMMAFPEASGQLPTDNIKQQIRTSQP